MQGTQRYVIMAFGIAGLLAIMTLSRVFSGLFFAIGVNDMHLIGAGFTLTTLISVVIGVALIAVLYKNPKSIAFTNEVAAELKKVTWPTKKETQTATSVVIVTTLVMSVLVFFMDNIWGALTGVIYK